MVDLLDLRTLFLEPSSHSSHAAPGGITLNTRRKRSPEYRAFAGVNGALVGPTHVEAGNYLPSSHAAPGSITLNTRRKRAPEYRAFAGVNNGLEGPTHLVPGNFIASSQVAPGDISLHT